MPADKLQITLAGREHVVDAGTTAGQALDGLAARREPQRTVRGRGDRGPGQRRAPRPGAPLSDGDAVEPVEIGSADGLAILRHSTAHVMAQAVQDLFPEAKLGIGPPIENGFYYDFDVPSAFGPEDLKAIEQKMRQIVKQGQLFSRREVTDEQAAGRAGRGALQAGADRAQGRPARPPGASTAPTEVTAEESVEVGGGELTIYDNLDRVTGERRWKDLCRGPHLPSTREIPAFKLMRSGGAYWRGSEKNPQLQRIYGTAWPSREAQDDYLTHAGRGRAA